LKIPKNGDPFAHLFGDLAHHLHSLRVGSRFAVGEVDTNDICACAQQLA
jgi:hypothetical protein